MRTSLLLTMAVLMAGTAVGYADNDYEDDIYYNPKKEKKAAEKINYIADFGNVDVDAYNRRGEQYYMTPVDTIGEYIGNGNDFVYTQKIQKYINPTIVVDNAAQLVDVLNNSYGNVEIVINDGVPYFAPAYYTYWPSYYYSYAWSPAWSWGWPSWNWSWGWGPSWAWTPGWSWGWSWGPSWGWGLGWGGWGPGWGPSRPGWGRDFYAHHYRPGGNSRPFAPGGNWAHNTRPGGNVGVERPGGRPSGNQHVASNRGYSINSAGHRVAPGVSVGGSTSATGSNRRGYTNAATNGRPVGTVNGIQIGGSNHRTQTGTYNAGGHRNYNSGSTYNGSGNRRTYNTNSGNHRSSTNSGNHRSYNSGSNRSYNSSGSMRSSGGSFGGGRSSGGSRGGGGGHRR